MAWLDQPCAVFQDDVLDSAGSQPLVDLLPSNAQFFGHLAGGEFLHGGYKSQPPPLLCRLLMPAEGGRECG